MKIKRSALFLLISLLVLIFPIFATEAAVTGGIDGYVLLLIGLPVAVGAAILGGVLIGVVGGAAGISWGVFFVLGAVVALDDTTQTVRFSEIKPEVATLYRLSESDVAAYHAHLEPINFAYAQLKADLDVIYQENESSGKSLSIGQVIELRKGHKERLKNLIPNRSERRKALKVVRAMSIEALIEGGVDLSSKEQMLDSGT
jgi:hypothetical protein